MDALSNSKYEVVIYSGKSTLNGAKNFSSGNAIIDKFVSKGTLRQQAKKSPGSGVKVLLDTQQNDKIIGFITITAFSLNKERFKGRVDNIGTTRDIPVVRLVMLGVDKEFQGKGLGNKLLRIAFDSTKKIAEAINCSGLYLEADSNAVEFYKKYNFVALDEPDPITKNVQVFLHLDSIP